MTRHLSTLSVLHYVYGAIICLSGLALLFVIGVGGLLGSDLVQQGNGDSTPQWIGRFIQGFGTTLFVVVEGWGVLNMLSGYWISRRSNRMASLVIGALNCLSVPLGLALGIFTLIALNDKEVEDAYAYPM